MLKLDTHRFICEQRRHSYINDICLLKGELSTQSLVAQLKAGKKILVENESRLNNSYLLQEINNNPHVDCAICISTKTAYGLDLISFLEQGVSRFLKTHPVLLEQIITASQEALANAVLWSNLELTSSKENLRGLDFDRAIQQKLKQSHFRNRSVFMCFSHTQHRFEVSLSVEGKPIEWPEESESRQSFRGVSVIKAFSNEVNFDNENHTLRLVFIR